MGKRVDIKTGYTCNNNCLFCVQAHNKYKGVRSIQDILKDMREAKANGCDEIVLTGGEVSIRKDFLELLMAAKALGFSSIQVQTNGRMFSYMRFMTDAADAGMTEFGPAVHGHIPELHDFLTQAPGSFEQTTQAIRNAKKLGLNILSNTVVVKPNYRYLPLIAKMLVDLGVDQYQFAYVHPIGNAGKNYDSMVPWMSMAKPFIHEGLKIGIDAKVMVMAEAVPYCMMEGYECHVSELYIPDTEIRSGLEIVKNWEETRKGEGKVKFPQCTDCKYDLVCEGPWKEYPENRGHEEFKALPGKKIMKASEILAKC
jgi:MoaA/NifB/PqqE/SkfB family radical SAM enzyme